MKTATVFGGGGFIGNHLVSDLKERGYFVVAVDMKHPKFNHSLADVFVLGDLRNENVVKAYMTVDEVYQLAADMGGAGYVFVKDNDLQIMLNSAQINLNTAKNAYRAGKVFFSSSACIYPEHNQKDTINPNTAENTAYPANPDSEYGWEKLFAERLYAVAAKALMPATVRIARFHNVYGPLGTYSGGREKAPAAICRKVAMAENGGCVQIWGDGNQTRSFMYITDCLKGIRMIMDSDYDVPINLGSSEIVSINDMAKMVIEIAGKDLTLNHVKGPEGVRGRTSDNSLIKSLFGWEPNVALECGLSKTYLWIWEQVVGK